MFGGDQLRYCTLTHNRFVYHSTKSEISEEAGILNFDLLSCNAKYNNHALVYFNNYVESASRDVKNSSFSAVLREMKKQRNGWKCLRKSQANHSEESLSSHLCPSIIGFGEKTIFQNKSSE